MKLNLSKLLLGLMLVALGLGVVFFNTQLGKAESQLEELQTKVTDAARETAEVQVAYLELKNDHRKLQTNYADTQAELVAIKQDAEKQIAEMHALRQENLKLKKKRAAMVTKANIPSRGSGSVVKEFYVEATAYTASCKGCSGITAMGINLIANPDAKVIAVDPNIIPLGTKVWVEGYGYAIAADKGGAIKGYKIDVFIPTKSEAIKFGRKKVKIRILN